MKEQSDLDKEIQNLKSFFFHLKQKIENLIKLFDNLNFIKQNELKLSLSLNAYSKEIINLNEIYSMGQISKLKKFIENHENETILYFKDWIKDIEDILLAINRRENLNDEVYNDFIRIEELNLLNLKTNNKVFA